MSFNAVREAIATAINDGWSATEVFWEALENDKPEQDEWIMVHILFNNSDPFSFGAVRQRTGLIQVDVYTRKNTGTKRERELIDNISTLLEGQRLSDVLVRDMSIDASIFEGAWRKTVVSMGFNWIED